jgi:hypothetical protein
MSNQNSDPTQGKSEPESPPESLPTEPADDSPGSMAHESDLFPPSSGPRYFGTGRYGTGGSNAEGNDGIGELNPRGGYGSFTDAGGPGATALYGDEPSVGEDDEKADKPPNAGAESEG